MAIAKTRINDQGERIDIATNQPYVDTPKPVASSAITPDSLSNVSQFNLSPQKVGTSAVGFGAELTSRINSDLKNQEATDALKVQTDANAIKEKKLFEESRSKLSSLLGIQESATAIKDEAYSKSDGVNPSVDASGKVLKDINAKINAIDIATNEQLKRIKEAGGGLMSGQNAEIQRIESAATSQKADLYIDKLVAQGDYTSALDTANRKVDMFMEQQKLDYDKTLFDYNENKDLFTKAEQRQFDLTMGDRKRALDNEEETKKTFEKTRIELLASASSQNAPQAIKDAISRSTTAEGAIQAAGQYAGDVLDREYKQSQIDENNAQAEKIKEEAIIAAQGGNPDDLTAYASRLADTGQLPNPSELKQSGLSVGQVAQFAKELPKQKGALVSSNTGVKSADVAAAAQEDFSRLYNITQQTNALIELDKKRWGGVVAGSLGKVFGSDAQGEYLTKRKAIVDDISRMQSGAALTEEEVKFYEEYLPGRLSQSFTLGQSSEAKIKNFQKEMNEKLANRLKNSGLSIYGYSKVKVGDTEYTVGDTISNGTSQGRVNPDGTVTLSNTNKVEGYKSKPKLMEEISFGGIEIPKSSRLAYVNNNPGNLRFAEQTGATKGEGGFAKFNSPQAGVKALENQIKLDSGRGLTLSKFINKYAPPTENNTSEYLQQAMKELGVSADTSLSKISLNKLLKFIAKKESSTNIS